MIVAAVALSSAAVALSGAAVACGGGSPGADEARGAADAPAEGSAAVPSEVRLATVEFDVDGMDCGGCALATEMALRKLDGVAYAEASFDDDTQAGSCSVRYDPQRVGTGEMIAAIEKIGFQPRLREVSGSE
ncbi:MAG: heavy-metal-associated domain-containing protein [Gemmatimonadota bacterium]